MFIDSYIIPLSLGKTTFKRVFCFSVHRVPRGVVHIIMIPMYKIGIQGMLLFITVGWMSVTNPVILHKTIKLFRAW